MNLDRFVTYRAEQRQRLAKTEDQHCIDPDTQLSARLGYTSVSSASVGCGLGGEAYAYPITARLYLLRGRR